MTSQSGPEQSLKLPEPKDYFRGIGQTTLPTPTNILLFLRTTRHTLQQEALQNRSHHRFVLALNLSTQGHVHADNRVLPFAPGQALLILPYQFHHFSQLAHAELQWLFCTFELTPSTFLEPLRNRVITVGDQSLHDQRSLVAAWIRGTASDWAEEIQETKLQSTLLQFLLSLKQDVQSSAQDLPPAPRDTLLRRINHLMSERHGRPIVTADIAGEMNISESRLRAKFIAAAGIPLGSYLQNYRLNRAMALLRTGDLPISEIAEEAGFGSPQAFSRLFRNKIGQSPRAYRQNAPHYY